MTQQCRNNLKKSEIGFIVIEPFTKKKKIKDCECKNLKTSYFLIQKAVLYVKTLYTVYTEIVHVILCYSSTIFSVLPYIQIVFVVFFFIFM